MLNQTATFYLRTAQGDRDRWTPAAADGIFFLPVAEAQTRASSEVKTGGTAERTRAAIIPAAAMPEELKVGDWLVPGECAQKAFTGSGAAVLLPLGGMRIERITRFSFRSPLDHAELVLRGGME